MIVFLMLSSGCSPSPDASRLDSSAAARKATGLAAAYVPEPIDATTIAEIHTSMLARRRFAWHAVAKALAPTNNLNLPTWATWYARDDFQRVFHKLYDDAGKPRRAARAPFSQDEVAAAFAWNLRAVEEMPSWPADRYAAWLASLDTEARQRGAAGLSRTFYAPGATAPFVTGYKQVEECLPKLPDLDLQWKNPDPANFTACFPREFDRDAAVAKTAWKRRDFGLKVPVYDTDAAALSRRLADHASGWGTPDRELEPTAGEIYTIESESGASFQLAGFHLMTKELREWTWITLWWSDDPDTDFGEDRPEEIRALGGPWANYKMCVVTTFADQDGDGQELHDRYPKLAAALGAARSDTEPYSWCSNPNVEEGVGNHRSNCMGCHQHAGSSLEPLDILGIEERFPGHGSARTRENFPADYLWSFGREPERLSGYIHSQIEHYDIYDQL